MIIKYTNFLYFFSIIFLFNFNAKSIETHGLAMNGMPKYKEGFTHLEYVNPNAPKGGAIKYALMGLLTILTEFLLRARKQPD